MSGRDKHDEQDERLERELRGLLADRDPGDAPRVLRDRVERVPAAETPAHARRSRFTSAARALAGLAAAAVLIVALVPFLTAGPAPDPNGPAATPGLPASVAPGATPLAPVGTFPPGAPMTYPEMRAYWPDGGILSADYGVLDLGTCLPVMVVAVLATLLVLAGIRSLRRRGRASAEPGQHPKPLDLLTPPIQGLAWIGVALAIVAIAATSQPVTAHTFTRSYGFAIEPPSADGDVVVIAPHPGQRSMMEYSLENRGLLPVLVEEPRPWTDPEGWMPGVHPIQPERFVSMRVPYEDALALPQPDPVLLWPGQVIGVRLLYEHLPCEAWGKPSTPTATPFPTLAPGATERLDLGGDAVSLESRNDIQLAASVLGMPRILWVTTDAVFETVLPRVCPQTEPMAVADVSHVPTELSLTTNNWPGIFGPDVMPWSRADPGIAILIVIASAAWLVRSVSRRRRPYAAVLLVAAVAGWWWTIQPAALIALSSDLAGQGVAEQVGDGWPDTFDVGAGGTLTFGFSIRNDDPVPVTVVGSPRAEGQLRLTGLGRPWNDTSADPAENTVFTPFTDLAPGQTIELLGVATAGSCTRRLDEAHDAWAMLTAIPFTYERLGARSTTLVPLVRAIRVPADAACLATAGEPVPDSGIAYYPVWPERGTITTEATGPLPYAVLAGIIGLAFVARLVRRRRLAVIASAAGMCVLFAWAGIGVLAPVSISVSWWSSEGQGLVDNPNADTEANRWFVGAGPGQQFTVGILVDAEAAVPVQLDGVVAAPGDGRWTGLWLSDLTGGGAGPANRPFAPVRLDRSFVPLWLTGSADACAVAGYDPGGAIEQGLTFTPARIRLRVSVLGFPRTIETPADAWPSQPLSTDCLATP